jgi:hypothetical protein
MSFIIDPRIQSQFEKSLDIQSPREALEQKTVGSTAVTFATALDHRKAYILFSKDATTYITLNGTNPSLSDGISSGSIGIPVPQGLEKPLFVPSGSQLRAIVSGSTNSVVTLYQVSLSASI